MNIYNRMMPRICRAPEGEGAGGSGTPSAGAGGAPGGDGTPPAVIASPWSAATGIYTVGEGKDAKPWWESISEQPVRELMTAKQYKNPTELAMAYHNLNKLQNNAGDVIALPKADAKPEELDAFYTKLGRPASADKYDLKVPDGVKPDEGMMKFGKELFFEMGLPPAKAQAAFEKWEKFAAEKNGGVVEAQRVANDAAITALEKKWGPELEVNKAAGNRAVKALGLSNELITSIEANIGSAAIVELLAAIGNKSKEGSFVGNGSNTGDPNDPSNMTKEQAQTRIKALQGDTEFQKRYTDKNHPEHKQALHTMEQLFAKGG